MSFTVYPAIDVRGGAVVRLLQGDYARETRYGDDPLAQAVAYARAGAEWLHLVDLDAARAGGYTLSDLLTGLRREAGLKVQTGGGVRSERDLVALLEAGAERVVVGSLAVRDPETVESWLGRYGASRITVALDTRCDETGQWTLPIEGWTQASTRTLDELARDYARAGLQHLLCTDIARDGMLLGPNLELYRHLRGLVPDLRLQASGGVRELADVRGAGEAGCAGVVLGKALLEGHLRLEEALAC
jgi:phosphoribosylformimino-5-aminoimidazole carboxamide ribotide isomerase